MVPRHLHSHHPRTSLKLLAAATRVATSPTSSKLSVGTSSPWQQHLHLHSFSTSLRTKSLKLLQLIMWMKTQILFIYSPLPHPRMRHLHLQGRSRYQQHHGGCAPYYKIKLFANSPHPTQPSVPSVFTLIQPSFVSHLFLSISSFTPK
ncbi:hypothetical protein RJT34_10080 [Clitoria ternatea]|uniref:Uncharacterized protein n=1 Tax=Clitoria ternatea TaxID=43366 RepID=A0AAN9PVT3_CLITE